jgi:hypothetical protein
MLAGKWNRRKRSRDYFRSKFPPIELSILIVGHEKRLKAIGFRHN